MNIIVVGCRKVGSRLASLLDKEGHDVSVVDNDANSFDLLDKDFKGFKTPGVPIDQDVLRQAGIENCDALAAVSPDDNVNIMVSQLARGIFNVPTVLARIYDPQRKDVFSHFGLYTVCPTNLTVSAVKSAITERDKTESINLASHTITFSTQDVPKNLVGTLASGLLFENTNSSLYAIIHSDLSITIYTGQKIRFEADDKVVISSIVD